MARTKPMPSLLARSRSHLAGVGEGYFQHMRFAATVARLLVSAGFACLLHALVPALFTDKASRTIRHLAAVIEKRQALDHAVAGPEDAFAPLLLLSLAVAALPWMMGADPAAAALLSVLTMGFPATFLWAERPRARPRAVRANAAAERQQNGTVTLATD